MYVYHDISRKTTFAFTKEEVDLICCALINQYMDNPCYDCINEISSNYQECEKCLEQQTKEQNLAQDIIDILKREA